MGKGPRGNKLCSGRSSWFAAEPNAAAESDAPSCAGEVTQSVLARRVAACGLSGTKELGLAAPLDDSLWGRLLDEMRAERMTGVLVAAVSCSDLPVSPEQEDQLARAHLEAMARDLFLERLALSVVSCLESVGVDHRMLKGAAVAHLDYPDPAMRSFVDVDVLVRSEQWEAAVGAVEGIGAERAFPEPRPGWDRRFTKCTMLRTAEGYEVDLHRTFVFGRFGLTVRLEDLWATKSTFSLGGKVIQTLDAEGRWLQACFSAALGDVPPRLAPLRDVVQLSEGGRLDPKRLALLTQRWEAEAVVRRAVVLATGILDVEVHEPIGSWARSLPVSKATATALAAYTRDGDRYVPLAVSAFSAVPGLRGKLSYAGPLVWPTREFIAGRYGGRRARWASAVRRFASGRSLGHLRAIASANRNRGA